MKTKTAIVLLNWNGQHFLEQFLDGVLKSAQLSDHAKVWIADNASTDGSVKWLQTNYPDVKLILLDQNYGFTGGYNKALSCIEAEYYLLLNTDVDVDPNFLAPLVAHLDQHADVAACAPKLLAYHQQNLFEHAGASGGYIDTLGYPFCRGRILDYTEEDKGQYDSIESVFWASGAALMVRADLYWQAGGLDDDFFAHMEEIDLCWRLQRMGYTISCIPTAKVYHVGGGVLPSTSSYKLYLNFRNNLTMLTLNTPIWTLLWVLPVRLCLDGLAGLVYILSGKSKYCWAIVRAHWAYFMMLPKTIRKRKQFKNKAVNSHLKGIYKGSIVFKYYLSKKNLTFKQLFNKTE